jgi:elongator complex protein 2
MAVAVSHASNLLATTCKASTPQHAVVRLYDTTTWKSLEQTLGGHTLTVTRLAFSRDDCFLVSVGRDRSWRLYERLVDAQGADVAVLRSALAPEADDRLSPGCSGYRPLAASVKPHARIIWDVAFSPLFPSASGADDMVFATGSRDKSAKVWRRPISEDPTVWEPVATLKFDEGVTSVDFYSGLDGARSVAFCCRPG